jgi:hypothetical protein
MHGIDRIKIVSNWTDPFLDIQSALEPAANALYPQIFANIGMPLVNPEVREIQCSKDEAMARYDWKEGIDTILHFASGAKATMQEKFLTYHISTVTFETRKASGRPGAWFYCTAQYYFIGYGRDISLGNYDFQDWMLVDFPGIHRADACQDLPWKHNGCRRVGSQFQFLYFDEVPTECVVSRYEATPDRCRNRQLSLWAAPPPHFR